MAAYSAHQQSLLAQILTEENIEPLLDILRGALKRRRRIWVIGNGGSLANAEHFAEDLGKGASDAISSHGLYSALNPNERDFRWRVQALSSGPWITALGNDCGYDRIFVEQLESQADAHDVLFGVSVSGTSPNLVEAFKWANEHELKTVALVGKKATESVDSIHAHAEHSLVIPSEHYGRVEDLQMTVFHTLCYYFIEGFTE